MWKLQYNPGSHSTTLHKFSLQTRVNADSFTHNIQLISCKNEIIILLKEFNIESHFDLDCSFLLEERKALSAAMFYEYILQEVGTHLGCLVDGIKVVFRYL